MHRLMVTGGNVMDAAERGRLLRRRRLLAKRLAGAEEFVRGSVVLMKRRCVRERCRRCDAGEGHPTWVLTVSEGGKTRTVYLGEKRLAEARRLAANYRRVRGWIEEVARVNLALLKAGPFEREEAEDG